MISGDKAKMEVDVATNMGIKSSIQEFLILEHATELLIMEVYWLSSLFWENCGDSTRLVNRDTFGTPISNPFDAEDDKFLDDANLEVYPWCRREKIA